MGVAMHLAQSKHHHTGIFFRLRFPPASSPSVRKLKADLRAPTIVPQSRSELSVVAPWLLARTDPAIRGLSKRPIRRPIRGHTPGAAPSRTVGATPG
jgi:hypothetical protein